MAARETRKQAARAPKAAAAGTATGYEAELWAMPDALRSRVDAAEYKHVVLGLIFLKHISDAFAATYARLALLTVNACGAACPSRTNHPAVTGAGFAL